MPACSHSQQATSFSSLHVHKKKHLVCCRPFLGWLLTQNKINCLCCMPGFLRICGQGSLFPSLLSFLSLSDSYSLIHHSRVVHIPRLSLCFTSYDFLIFWCTCKPNKCLTFPKFPDLSIEYHLLSAMLPPSIGWFLTHRVTQIYRMYMVSRASAAMTHILLIFCQPPFLS